MRTLTRRQLLALAGTTPVAAELPDLARATVAEHIYATSAGFWSTSSDPIEDLNALVAVIRSGVSKRPALIGIAGYGIFGPNDPLPEAYVERVRKAMWGINTPGRRA